MAASSVEIREECAQAIENFCDIPWCDSPDECKVCPSRRLAALIRGLNCRERGHAFPVIAEEAGRPLFCTQCLEEIYLSRRKGAP